MDLDNMKGLDLTPFTSTMVLGFAYMRWIQKRKYTLKSAADTSASKKRWPTLWKALEWRNFISPASLLTFSMIVLPFIAQFFFRKYQTIEQTRIRLAETLAQIFSTALSFVYVDSD